MHMRGRVDAPQVAVTLIACLLLNLLKAACDALNSNIITNHVVAVPGGY